MLNKTDFFKKMLDAIRPFLREKLIDDILESKPLEELEQKVLNKTLKRTTTKVPKLPGRK